RGGASHLLCRGRWGRQRVREQHPDCRAQCAECRARGDPVEKAARRLFGYPRPVLYRFLNRRRRDHCRGQEVTRIAQLKPEFVEFIPDRLEPGVLFISRRYSTATHLCCCGCGLEVVTPLKPTKWSLIERSGAVWLKPSVGNWSFPCRSHYWIEGNRVRWADA